MKYQKNSFIKNMKSLVNEKKRWLIVSPIEPLFQEMWLKIFSNNRLLANDLLIG